jgi:hypothetical protein
MQKLPNFTMRHYVIKFVSDFVSGFLRYSEFLR